MNGKPALAGQTVVVSPQCVPKRLSVPIVGDREFEIQFLDPGVEAFAFTFG